MAVKPRVFVSSVVEGFREYRQAAREGIVAAGGEPILVNEDFPALAASSRNVCLDAVDSSDAYVVIVGERGGWTTPSGKLVVEEEYERARQRRLPVLVFVQRGTRDTDELDRLEYGTHSQPIAQRGVHLCYRQIVRRVAFVLRY